MDHQTKYQALQIVKNALRTLKRIEGDDSDFEFMDHDRPRASHNMFCKLRIANLRQYIIDATSQANVRGHSYNGRVQEYPEQQPYDYFDDSEVESDEDEHVPDDYELNYYFKYLTIISPYRDSGIFI